jgi:hypothetical protein
MGLQEAKEEDASERPEEQAVCHVLPCSIDYSGRLNGAQHFFRPTVVEEGDENNDSPILAATLRGRGLLGRKISLSREASQNTEKGAFASPSIRLFGIAGADQEHLTVEGTAMDHVIEWHHEHLPANLPKNGRLATAQAWFQVAQALHEPLPMAEEF